MSCYDALARWYDSLTGDVPYGAFADFYEKLFAADGGEFHLLLDLCCGTGTLTWELAGRGYEMIGADRSVEMLMEAQGKSTEGVTPPLFLCQSAEELDLYGTVDLLLSRRAELSAGRDAARGLSTPASLCPAGGSADL